MKKLLSIICAMLLMLITGCKAQPPAQGQADLPPERTEELYALCVQLTGYLHSNNTDAAMAMMNEDMTEALDGNLERTWAQLGDSLGVFIETGNYAGMASGDYDILEMTLVFEKGTLIQRVAFDSDNRIAGLRHRDGEVEQASGQELPEGIAETDVTVNAGDGYPLAGKLTLPENETPVAAVVLVHGSGSGDMNETIGANHPFRDLAYGLAQKGIAVLRYDKRTYAHGAALSGSGTSITLDEEVAYDALAAVKLLKSRDEINAESVYLLGRSMGGGLLSYINSKGAGCAGYIVMAGTPRKPWEISAEQNLLTAEELEEGGDKEQAEQIRQFVEAERLRAEGLANLSGNETLFGLSASYLQEFERIDTISLHANDGLPILVLHGGKDRQVTMTDFSLWQAELFSSAHPAAYFNSYPALNHLFGEYAGDPVPFSQLVAVEYSLNTPVADEVIADISSWIKENSR